jgi:hypothetical protein
LIIKYFFTIFSFDKSSSHKFSSHLCFNHILENTFNGQLNSGHSCKFYCQVEGSIRC